MTSSGHVVCPSCSAKLRLRARPAVAVPQNDGTSLPAGDVLSSATDGAAVSDAAAQPASTRSGSREREPDATLDPGTRLGGFELRRVLGRGGMATVYKATQLSLNRPVAVKVLAKRFSTNTVFVDRFDREAGALAGLNHPNIVNIIDKGVFDENYFFVMEIVEGITLDQLLHSVELTEQHYLHIISEISKALAYVHSRGIIHRDIKPSNILVNRQGVVKVGDFGIAHMTDAEAPAERFGRNAMIGTAHYMSPEQASNPGSVDQRADIYSLAITFYKMFTRQLPPPGVDLPITPPSEINNKLPKAVDAILRRAMERDPAARYADVTEFCDSLARAFTSRTGSDLVGAAAASAVIMTESGSGLFSTNLFAAAPSDGGTGSGFSLSSVGSGGFSLPSTGGAESASNAGESAAPALSSPSLLSAPMGIPGLVPDSTSSGFGMPAPAPSSFASQPVFNRPEPEPSAASEPGRGRTKLYVILAIVFLALAAGALFGIRMWMQWSAYGQFK